MATTATAAPYRRAALAEIERRKRSQSQASYLRENFAAFVRASWDTAEPAKPLIDNWHIDAIAEHLEAIKRRDIRFLLINIGPGFAKSLLTSVMFSAWLWTHSPATRILSGTYAGNLTIRDSIKVRSLLESPWYRETFTPNWKLTRRNEDHLANSKSGYRLALSVDGAGTGFRGDGQIIDDVMNAKEAHSEAARSNARRWLFETMSSRFDDMRVGWRIVIGQRLHEKDPYGELLATGEYTHLCLPTEFEATRRCVTVLGTNADGTEKAWTDPRTGEGELLFPALFTPAVVAQAKRDLGSYGYAGQHQQRPAPADGGLFKRSWFNRFDVEKPPSFDLMAISLDATFKESSTSDFVAIQVWGFVGPRAYLMDVFHERAGYIETKAAMKRLIGRWPQATARLIEDKANGSAIIQELKREFPGVIAIEPEGGKESRANAISPEAEAGNFYFPETPWADKVIEELILFPNAAHDDQVDAMTQAINWYRSRARKFGLLKYWEAEKAKEEAAMIAAGQMAKPMTAAITERCAKCDSISIGDLYSTWRCNNCGWQWPKAGAEQKQAPGPNRYDMLKKR